MVIVPCFLVEHSLKTMEVLNQTGLLVDTVSIRSLLACILCYLHLANFCSNCDCFIKSEIGLFVCFIVMHHIFKCFIQHCSTFAHAAIDFLLDCLMVLLVLICSILISTGAYEWCKCVTQRFSTCDIAASVMVIGSNSTINATNFSIQLDTLQVCQI